MNIELLREAYAVIDGIPDNRFNLNEIASNTCNDAISYQLGTVAHNCGTVACAAGWLGMHPKFRALGLNTTRNGYIKWNGSMSFSEVLAHVFECSTAEALALFEERTEKECEGKYSEMSHKRIWQARVRKYLKKH